MFITVAPVQHLDLMSHELCLHAHDFESKPKFSGPKSLEKLFAFLCLHSFGPDERETLL